MQKKRNNKNKMNQKKNNLKNQHRIYHKQIKNKNKTQCLTYMRITIH